MLLFIYCYAECCLLSVVMLNVNMLNAAVMLNVVAPNTNIKTAKDPFSTGRAAGRTLDSPS